MTCALPLSPAVLKSLALAPPTEVVDGQADFDFRLLTTQCPQELTGNNSAGGREYNKLITNHFIESNNQYFISIPNSLLFSSLIQLPVAITFFFFI